MSEVPSPNGIIGHNGRGAGGRFVKGNAGGPGNPHGRRTAAMRALLQDAVTDDDIRAVIAKLVELAKSGDLAAIRELLDRLMGKPRSTIEIERAEITETELDEAIEHELAMLADLRQGRFVEADSGTT